MNGFSFAHLSDLHLPFEPRLSPSQRLSKRQLSAWSWRRRGHLQSAEILDALVRDVREQAVDHIVITGDVTNFSLPEEFSRAAAWLDALAPATRISVVPGNHDALVGVAEEHGLQLWTPWTRADSGWPFVEHHAGIALIGLNSAVPTAPLLASGRLGDAQLSRLERILVEEGAAGRIRIVALHHPVADGAVRWRKALADRGPLRAVLRRCGAELILHGHARDARLDAIAGPGEPIPSVSVPSSSALPNPQDEGARWHRLRVVAAGARVEIEVRRWSTRSHAFTTAGRYDLCLPRVATGRREEYAAASTNVR